MADLSTTAQQEIIAQFKNGNKEAFSQVYNAYYEDIFRFIIRRVGEGEAAYDLTAESFLKAFDNFQRFSWRGISLKSWLYRIASNQLKNYYRRSSKMKIHPLDIIPEGLEHMAQEALEELKEAEQEVKKNHQITKLRNCLKELKPVYQTAVSLKYSAGLSLEEIASTMNKSQSAVKALLHRAIKQLRTMGLEATLALILISFTISRYLP